MLTLTDKIASWEDDYLASDHEFGWRDSAATEEYESGMSAGDEDSNGLRKTLVESPSLDDGWDVARRDSIATAEEQSESPLGKSVLTLC